MRACSVSEQDSYIPLNRRTFLRWLSRWGRGHMSQGLRVLVLAISALISAALRLETHFCSGNERVAAKALALALEEIARMNEN